VLSVRRCFAILAFAFISSRFFYFSLGVRFNAAPLNFYLQYIDPKLLKDAFWQSLFYLKEQPPGYNFYLGAVLHLFPESSTLAFYGVHLAIGFAMGWALFLLLDRVGVNRTVALTIAVVVTVSPVTVLYETWLFYSYPTAALFILAALFLHRYGTEAHLLDGTLFFASLAALGTLHTVYHPFWFVLIAAGVVWLLPGWRRRTAIAAAGPAALLCGIYLKHLILFGGFVPGGEGFQSTNLALMTVGALSPDALSTLEESGRISPILEIPVFSSPGTYSRVVSRPPRAGIDILDEPYKSTGAPNWNSLWMGEVGRQYGKDARVALLSYPGIFVPIICHNVEWYFLPADFGWPFDGTTHPNAQALAPALRVFDRLTTGMSGPSGRPWMSFVVLPGLVLFGLWSIAGWLFGSASRQPPMRDATGLVLMFVVFNIVYVAAVTIAFSFGDHNRYRYGVSGLFAVLLGLAVTAGWRAFSRAAFFEASQAALSSPGGHRTRVELRPMIEVFARRMMMRRVKTEDVGDTEFLIDE